MIESPLIDWAAAELSEDLNVCMRKNQVDDGVFQCVHDAVLWPSGGGGKELLGSNCVIEAALEGSAFNDYCKATYAGEAPPYVPQYNEDLRDEQRLACVAAARRVVAQHYDQCVGRSAAAK